MQYASICHVNLARDSKLRGGERQTELLVRELANILPRQRLVILRRGPLANRMDDVPNLHICRVNNRFAGMLACRKSDLIHAHEAHAAQAAYAATMLGGRYIITRRVDNRIGNSFYTKAMYKNAKTVVALSSVIETRTRERCAHVPIARIPSAWTPSEADAEIVEDIKGRYKDKFLVGHIAAMDDENKGHHILLQAARIVQKECPAVQFLLLGGGRLEARLQQQASDLQNVDFAGWVPEPFTWIPAFNAFAFPSLMEGLGSILLDVLKTGVPVIASRAGGIPDVITDSCGILVPPGDAEALADALIRLYESPERQKSLSQEAKARGLEFSPQIMAQSYVALYRSLGTIF